MVRLDPILRQAYRVIGETESIFRSSIAVTTCTTTSQTGTGFSSRPLDVYKDVIPATAVLRLDDKWRCEYCGRKYSKGEDYCVKGCGAPRPEEIS